MVITITGIAFVVLGLGLALCGLRFFKAFTNAEGISGGSKIRFLLIIYFISFAVQTGVIFGFGTLLLSHIPQGLFYVLIVAHSFLTFIAAVAVYMVYYIFFPALSWRFSVVFTILLGVVTVALTIVTSPKPFVTQERVINWNEPLALSIPVFFLLLVSIGASLYLFMRLYFKARTREIKILSFYLALVPALGIVDAFIDLVLLRGSITNIGSLVSDLGFGVGGLVLIFVSLVLPTIAKIRNS